MAKGIIFSLEALLTLLISLALLSFALPSNRALNHERIYENALAQDFLQASVKNQATLEKIISFGKGDVKAKNFLEKKYSRLLNQTGADCLRLELNNEFLSTCKGKKNTENIEKNYENYKSYKKSYETASGTRLVFDGSRFAELKLTLYFAVSSATGGEGNND